MAAKVSVVTTDDPGGLAGAETVAFGLDALSYQTGLAPPDKARLADALAPCIAAGRPISRSGLRPWSRPAAGRVDRAAVRARARQAGLAVSERGRISAEVMRQYKAAH